MSSSYHLLCASHDPALVLDDRGYSSAAEAEHAIEAGREDHPACDLLIGRWSGALVEVGCPPTRMQHADRKVCIAHGGTSWITADVLRLLTAARASADQATRAAGEAFPVRCWPPARVERLHAELGLSTT